jgi:aerobic carbon-monoxide dehydrogenase medium subunit
MYSINYHRPSSLAEAMDLMGGSDGKFVAGGQTLIPAMRLRLAAPGDLIDLAHIGELKGIEISGRDVTIRAGATHAEVAGHPGLKALCPALCQLASLIGDPHVRHRGTIGGSIANNDPAADYPAAVLALGATVTTTKRRIEAGDFFRGLFETALEEDEIVTTVSFAAPEKAGYARFSNPASRFALTGVFVTKSAAGFRVAVTGAGEDGVFRAKEIETALSRNFDASALEGLVMPANRLMSDIHASAEYRANLIVVMAKRAARAAMAS